MKIKATKTMTKFLRDEATKRGENCNIKFVQLSERAFALYCDYDIYRNEADFDFDNNMFNCIKIEYPAEFYANNRYISTRELNYIFRQSDKTAAGFLDAFFDNIAI